MQYDDFVGQVQNRAKLSSGGEAVKAIRATLDTLSRRLPADDVRKIEAQLPEEIAFYLQMGEETLDKIDLDQFFSEIQKKEDLGLNTSVFHCRAVMSVLCDALSPGEVEKLKRELPEEYAPLLESGAEGRLQS